jgi:hypothetical protein
MPSAIDEIIRRRVIQQWISGIPRDKIALENNIGCGTVSSIVSDFKKDVQNSEDLDSVRQFVVDVKKQGFSLSNLPAHIRLHNFFIESGVTEEEIESFIDRIHSTDMPQEKVIEYVNQIHEIAKEESIPLGQISNCVNS